MRAFFHPANPGFAASNAAIVSKSGLPLQAARTLTECRTQIGATTANVGNLIHNEAVAKTFRIDLDRSCFGSIERLYRVECKGNSARFREKLKGNFDAVFFSFANMIAPPARGREESQAAHFALLTETLRAIDLPVYFMGMGMQAPLAGEESIPSAMLEFLREINMRAEIFGVRGAETQAFLKSISCNNAIALGCPSLYVYVDNLRGIRPLENLQSPSGVTAGYLDRRHLLGYQPERLHALGRIAQSLEVSYVFQNDLYTLNELSNVPEIYNDADGRISPEIVNSYLKAFGVDLAFSDYRFFRDPRGWRQFAASRDFFFGDRFHGGVASLQAGRPAFFVWHDLRVRELTSHFGIPSMSLDELNATDPKDLLLDAYRPSRLSEMLDVYNTRVDEFFKLCEERGLRPLGQVRISRRKRVQQKLAALNYLEGLDFDIQLNAAIDLFKSGAPGLDLMELVCARLLEKGNGEEVCNFVELVLEDLNSVKDVGEAQAFRLGRMLHRSGHDEAAIRILSFFLRRDPADWSARVLMVQVPALLRCGRVSDAEDILSRAPSSLLSEKELVRCHAHISRAQKNPPGPSRMIT